MTDAELINKIAIEVMGWKEKKIVTGHSLFSDEFCQEPDPIVWVKPEGGWLEKHQWNPLIHIDHAFMVVERMRELGWDFQITIRQGSLWHVLFEMYPSLYPHIGVFNETIGRAICLPALKAVGMQSAEKI